MKDLIILTSYPENITISGGGNFNPQEGEDYFINPTHLDRENQELVQQSWGEN